MSNELSFETEHTALICLDLQTAIVSVYGQGQPQLLLRIASLQSSARAHGIKVIHVQTGFRPGIPEISSENPLYNAVKSVVEQHQLEIHPSVSPLKEEVVVVKHRSNAFTGTDLEMVLRAQGINTLILVGVATGGTVFSTLSHASDADYRTIVVKDCCAELDAEVHETLVNKVFPDIPLSIVLESNVLLSAFSSMRTE